MSTDERAEAAASPRPGEDTPSEPPKGKKTDESWKEKARKEKEKLATDSRAESGPAYPPASFLGIVKAFWMHAQFALGQMRDPMTGDVHFDLEGAKYAIDQLGVLQQKTKGNLEPGEKAELEAILHSLRLAFVHVSKNPPTSSGQPPTGGIDSLDPGGPETEPDSGGPKIIV